MVNSDIPKDNSIDKAIFGAFLCVGGFGVGGGFLLKWPITLKIRHGLTPSHLKLGWTEGM